VQLTAVVDTGSAGTVIEASVLRGLAWTLPIATSPSTWTMRTASGRRAGAGGSARRALRAGLVLLAALLPRPAVGSAPPRGWVEPPQSPGRPYVYRVSLAVSEALEPFLREAALDNDLFPDERVARDLIARLSELSTQLKQGADPARAASALLDSGFHGGRLLPREEEAVTRTPALQVVQARAMAPEPVLDAKAFAPELAGLLREFRRVTTAEFLVTALTVDRERGSASAEVRYDLVGPGRAALRVQRVGRWQMRWQKGPAGWHVVEWTALGDTRSSLSAPIFTEVTTAAFGAIDSFRRQLSISLGDWGKTLDSALARDSNGHHGIAVADVDGDGREDVYVGQPHGFPNRLYRARGDGTFEDATERSGLGILEDTQHALFADVDNDGDQDLVLTLSSGPSGPVLYRNDGTGRFARDPDGFRFAHRLQGAPMGMAIADYDRDGFPDVYLCVYSYQYGAGEGKAGTPKPYYDATNGPPNVLFRNDGHGRFVDVTDEVGLDAGNDRFSFSAAWGDYDGDGWPDLVVTNDFGRKNLYHNLGPRDGRVRFEDVSARAGIEDYAAGMSVFWFDFDGDGRLDIYGGQMWSDSGLRVTASPDFMRDAPERVRELYHHHARGNSLFRNRGDGTFEDVSVAARAEMGRWNWSSGALDFDTDGWEDIYCVNGMITREGSDFDLDPLFWGGMVARSPLTVATGTRYDDAWRALNWFMADRSEAGHHRNVFLRNDGRGGFDDVSGALGLDLDEDGRVFSVLDFDHDGDPDILSFSPRGTPELRLFRDDFAPRGATLAVRLVGVPSRPFESAGGRLASSRDAIGARVTVETDRLRRTKVVNAGSGFLSQHSTELLFGLGPSRRVERLTVEWPSGRRQEFTDVPLERRVRIEEGGDPTLEPYASAPPLAAEAAAPRRQAPPRANWLFEPFPVPDAPLQDLEGRERSLSTLRGRPAVLLFWSAQSSESQTALQGLARGAASLAQAGVRSLAISLDGPADAAKVRAAARGASALPVAVASDEAALGFAILFGYLFLTRQPLPLPTVFLLDSAGRVVKVYREGVDVPSILRDAAAIEVPPDERLARALPFGGTLESPPPSRSYNPYGRELLDQGLERQAVVAFEYAAKGSPSPAVLYRLGSLLARTGQRDKARDAYERALALEPDLAEASNDLGALLAEEGELPAAIDRFRAALAATPEYPDALNNLGYALLLTGREGEARELYERALKLQPDFPEALNNLGLILGRQGDLDGAYRYFSQALRARPDYGEAANNLALVLVRRGRIDEAIRLLEDLLGKNPASESTYVTLAKIYLATDRREEGLRVLDRLLARNPSHPEARELAARFR
jgi:Tfp pilus assembly protein PilF/peroxiredoxin